MKNRSTKVTSVNLGNGKVYLIKYTTSRHYFINQAIHGKIFYRTWTRTTKDYALSLLRGFHGEVLPHITMEVVK